MTIEAAMLQAFLLLLVAVAVVSAIVAIVWLLVGHPGVLFSIVAAVFFAILTISFYVGGNAT